MRERNGVSLVEVLVAMAVVGVLLAVLLPAVMRARAAATRTACQNKLHQIGLGMHGYATKHGGKLPSIDGNPRQFLLPGMDVPAVKCDFPLFVAILPDMGVPHHPGTRLSIYLEYICPDDPSFGPAEYTRIKGATVSPTSYPGNSLALVNNPSLTANFPDGLSNTIGVAERYVTCGKLTQHYHEFELSYNVRRPTFADGGPAFGGKNFADVYPVTEKRQTKPSRPGTTFVAAGRLWKYTHETATNDRPIPEPRPGDCDPQLPNTPHAAGMNVLLMDGSVRTVRVGVDPGVFWAAVTPAGVEVPGDL